jgi:hypothetical protein
MIIHHDCIAKDQANLQGSSRVTPKPINCYRAPSHPIAVLQGIIGNQSVRRLVQSKRVNDLAALHETGIQRQPYGRGIDRQDKERCVLKWQKQPEKMSLHAAEYFLGSEIDANLTTRHATVDCVRDNDCTVTVAKGGPVLDVHWYTDVRRIGVGFNHANGRRFCAYDYDGCDQFNRHTPDGVLTLTLVSCHGPKP